MMNTTTTPQTIFTAQGSCEDASTDAPTNKPKTKTAKVNKEDKLNNHIDMINSFVCMFLVQIGYNNQFDWYDPERQSTLKLCLKGKPQKGRSAYAIFLKKFKTQINERVAKESEETGVALKFIKVAGVMWKEVKANKELHDRLIKKSKKDKIRYENEMKTWDVLLEKVKTKKNILHNLFDTDDEVVEPEPEGCEPEGCEEVKQKKKKKKKIVDVVVEPEGCEEVKQKKKRTKKIVDVVVEPEGCEEVKQKKKKKKKIVVEPEGCEVVDIVPYEYEGEKEFITITLGDVAENHVRNQQIGNMHAKGYSKADLLKAQEKFESIGVKCEFIDFGKEDDACALVARNATNVIAKDQGVTAGDVFDEMRALEWDKKAFMYGKVLNKHARHNLCFNYEGQEPCYEKGEGTIIAWDTIPNLHSVFEEIQNMMGEGLVAEGNRYYDKTTGIGWHGDAERRKVVGCRFGESMNMNWQWYLRSEPIGELFTTVLNHGDLYIMGSKAVGTDWTKKTIPTLRHSAGSAKYTTYKPKKGKSKK
jgi:alkylated DNA repair dioxygenase AlkB